MLLWLGTVLVLAGLVAADFDEDLAAWQKLTAEQNAEPEALKKFNPPPSASEWYTVTIADVSVGYMHTTVNSAETRVSTMEIMDVQVSRGTDTSRMAFETVFHEDAFDKEDALALSYESSLKGGVQARCQGAVWYSAVACGCE